MLFNRESLLWHDRAASLCDNVALTSTLSRQRPRHAPYQWDKTRAKSRELQVAYIGSRCEKRRWWKFKPWCHLGKVRLNYCRVHKYFFWADFKIQIKRTFLETHLITLSAGKHPISLLRLQTLWQISDSFPHMKEVWNWSDRIWFHAVFFPTWEEKKLGHLIHVA